MSLKLEVYRNDCFSLVKSIMLKSDLLAKEVESLIDPTLSFLDPHTGLPKNKWKYYLNAAGEMHESNVEITMISYDTLTSINLSKGVLVNHPYTVKLLMEFGEIFEDVLKDIPDERMRLHGMLLGKDVDDIINMSDYSIIGYTANLVEVQEINLIPELSKRMNRIGRSIGNSGYFEVESGWVTGLMFILSQQLLVQLELLRYEVRLKTTAHTYFMWLHINSYLYLQDLEQLFQHSEVVYLFKNIRRLVSGTSTDGVLLELVDFLGKNHQFQVFQLGVELDLRKINAVSSKIDHVFIEKDLLSNTTRPGSRDGYLLEHETRSRFKLTDYSTDLDNKLTHKVDVNKVPELYIYLMKSLDKSFLDPLILFDYYYMYLELGLVTDSYSIPSNRTNRHYSLSYREALILYVRLVQIRGSRGNHPNAKVETFLTEDIPIYTTHQVAKADMVRPTSSYLQATYGVSAIYGDLIASYIPPVPNVGAAHDVLNKYLYDSIAGLMQIKKLSVIASNDTNILKMQHILGEYIDEYNIELAPAGTNFDAWLLHRGIGLGGYTNEELDKLERSVLREVFKLPHDVGDDTASLSAEFLRRFTCYRTNITTSVSNISSVDYVFQVPYERAPLSGPLSKTSKTSLGAATLGVSIPAVLRVPDTTVSSKFEFRIPIPVAVREVAPTVEPIIRYNKPTIYLRPPVQIPMEVPLSIPNFN